MSRPLSMTMIQIGLKNLPSRTVRSSRTSNQEPKSQPGRSGKVWKEPAQHKTINMYDEIAAREGIVLNNKTRAACHSTVVRKWKEDIKGKRDKRGRKSQLVILRIARGGSYRVINDGNKYHTLAQGEQGGLDPRAVFGGAQDWPAQTATRDFNRYSEV